MNSYRITNSKGQSVLSKGDTPREALQNMLNAVCHPYGIVMQNQQFENQWMIQHGHWFTVDLHCADPFSQPVDEPVVVE